MRSGSAALVITCAAALLAGSCDFVDTAPPGAVILCITSADCPSAQVCNEAVHECVPEGAALDALPPALLSAAFSPAVVNDAPVELLITADEALGEAPTLSFGGVSDPGFVLSDLTGPSARFLLDTSTVAAGAYPLDAVILADLIGNTAARLTPGAALVVDRDAPGILGLVVSHVNVDAAANGLPFSAQPGTNALQVTFIVDEAVAADDIVVTAGPEAATCTAGGASSFVCTAAVTSAFNDGTDRVSVAVSDGAGNEAEAFANIETDLRAPALVDSVTVLRRPGSAFVVGAALTGGTLEVDLIVDEPLGEPPTFALTGDVTLANVAVTLVTPVRVRLTAIFELVGNAGEAALEASVRDRVGNATVLALPAIPLAAAVVAPCAPLVAGTTCVDVDGDGDFAITAGCVGAADCDDTDPVTHSTAAEIPGDGIDNDCLGDGDLPIDETAGVLPDSAPPQEATARAAPAASFDDARALLAGRAWVFLADDGGSNYNTGFLRESVLGGLDENWQRQKTVKSDLDVDGFADPTGTAGLIVMDSMEVRNDIAAAMTADVRLTFVRSELPSDLVMRERVVAVDSRTHPLTIDPFVVGSLLSRSIISEAITVSEGSDVTLLASDMEDFNPGSGDHIVALAGSRVEVVNSLIASIACAGCTLRVTHSVVVGLADLPQLVDAQGAFDVELRSNIFTWLGAPTAPGATAVRSDGAAGALVVLNNLFHAPALDIPPVVVASATFADAAALNACGPPACAQAGGNRAGDPLFGAERGHIEAASPAVDGAAATYDGLPTALALDIDGDCRTPGTADIGVDER